VHATAARVAIEVAVVAEVEHDLLLQPQDEAVGDEAALAAKQHGLMTMTRRLVRSVVHTRAQALSRWNLLRLEDPPLKWRLFDMLSDLLVLSSHDELSMSKTTDHAAAVTTIGKTKRRTMVVSTGHLTGTSSVSNLPYHQLMCSRSRRYSRPSTPAPRIVRRQSSDPSLHEPLAIERRVYDEDEDDYQRFLRPASRRPSHMRVTSNPHPRREIRYSSENDDTYYEQTRRASTRRPRSVIVRSRGRGRDRPDSPKYGKWSRIRSINTDDKYLERQTSRRRSSAVAPEPPGWDGAAENTDWGHASGGQWEEPETRRRSRSRRTSRVRSRSHSRSPQPASEFLHPGDEVTVIEHHQPKPTEDYDWYDRDGMRVRVREI
jgi:hypothetical protein